MVTRLAISMMDISPNGTQANLANFPTWRGATKERNEAFHHPDDKGKLLANIFGGIVLLRIRSPTVYHAVKQRVLMYWHGYRRWSVQRRTFGAKNG